MGKTQPPVVSTSVSQRTEVGRPGCAQAPLVTGGLVLGAAIRRVLVAVDLDVRVEEVGLAAGGGVPDVGRGDGSLVGIAGRPGGASLPRARACLDGRARGSAQVLVDGELNQREIRWDVLCGDTQVFGEGVRAGQFDGALEIEQGGGLHHSVNAQVEGHDAVFALDEAGGTGDDLAVVAPGGHPMAADAGHHTAVDRRVGCLPLERGGRKARRRPRAAAHGC